MNVGADTCNTGDCSLVAIRPLVEPSSDHFLARIGLPTGNKAFDTMQFENSAAKIIAKTLMTSSWDGMRDDKYELAKSDDSRPGDDCYSFFYCRKSSVIRETSRVCFWELGELGRVLGFAFCALRSSQLINYKLINFIHHEITQRNAKSLLHSIRGKSLIIIKRRGRQLYILYILLWIELLYSFFKTIPSSTPQDS